MNGLVPVPAKRSLKDTLVRSTPKSAAEKAIRILDGKGVGHKGIGHRANVNVINSAASSAASGRAGLMRKPNAITNNAAASQLDCGLLHFLPHNETHHGDGSNNKMVGKLRAERALHIVLRLREINCDDINDSSGRPCLGGHRKMPLDGLLGAAYVTLF